VEISLTWPLDTAGLVIYYLDDYGDSTWDVTVSWTYSGGVLTWSTLKPGFFVIGKTLGSLKPERAPRGTAASIVVYPNPFTPTTTIHFQAPNPSDIRIYDLNGQLIRNWSGGKSVVWNGQDLHSRDVASGTYIVRVNVGERVMSRRIVLMR